MSATPKTTLEPTEILSSQDWQLRAARHRQRALKWTTPARQRRTRGHAHPVNDFLFVYYPFSMKKLGQWHPGSMIGLETVDPMPDWLTKPPYLVRDALAIADPREISDAAHGRLRWIRDLLVATRDRTPNFGCFGLHEWAMVHGGQDVRHRESCPLRLSQKEIDDVVESRPICCSHFDAFRFFQPDARPLNHLQPTLDLRMELEQPGCVHVGMDLYKWCSKSIPWVRSDLQLDCFELAVELRSLDMRASPYDLSEFELEPVKIETPEGRQEYERAQREFTRRAAPLRQQLIDELSIVTSSRTA